MLSGQKARRRKPNATFFMGSVSCRRQKPAFTEGRGREPGRRSLRASAAASPWNLPAAAEGGERWKINVATQPLSLEKRSE